MKRRPRSRPDSPPESRARLQQLLAELQVHSAELKAQNESLAAARHELEQSRDRLSDLYDFAPIAYVMHDDRGFISDLNLTASAMLGIARQHAVQTPLLRYVDVDSRPAFLDHLMRSRNESRVATDLDLRLTGRLHPVQLVTTHSNATPIVQPEFRTAILDMFHRQIAEQRRMELVRETARRDEVERLSRAKDEFFAHLAHELRTPLNAVHGWVYLLAGGRLSEDETQRAIRVISRNVQAQIALINDMLDVSRIIRGTLELRMQAVDLVELLQDLVEASRPLAREAGITLACHIETMGVAVEGDTDRLTQVFSNLMSNALKFTPEGGTVSVRVERGVWMSDRAADNDCGRVTITDSGIGLDGGEIGELFEPFRTQRRSTDRRHGGLGLGLAIVRRLVELHGGSVRAASEGPGRGAEFVVELPLRNAVPRALVPIPAETIGPSSNLNGVTVLMADDDDQARDIVRRMLEPLGASVKTVSSAAQAYEALRAEHPDVLVSDLAMPDEDGLSLIRRVRALPAEEGGATPAIALTAYAGAGDEARVVAAGFQTYVAKPVDQRTLAQLIGSLAVLNKRAAH